MTLNFPDMPPLPDLADGANYNQRVLDMFTHIGITMVQYMEGLSAEDFFQVQSDPLDTTDGKLMKVGAFGLGAITPSFVADLDDHSLPIGFYGVQTSTAGTRPDGATNYGFLQIERQSLTGIKQTYTNSNGEGEFSRTASSGIFTEWRKTSNDASEVPGGNIDNATFNGVYTGFGSLHASASSGDNPFPALNGAFSLVVDKLTVGTASEYVVQTATSLGGSTPGETRQRIKNTTANGWQSWTDVLTSAGGQTIDAGLTILGRLMLGTNVGGQGSLTMADYLAIRRNTDGWLLKHERTDNSNALGIKAINHSASGLQFVTANAARLTVLNNGNSGIGETNPDEKLVVSRLGSSRSGAYPLDAITAIQTHPGADSVGSGSALQICSNDGGTSAVYFGDTLAARAGALDYSHSTNALTFRANDADKLVIESGSVIRPAVDNAQDLGSASYRWDDIFATNTVIQTSDANLKTGVRDFSDAERRVATALKSMAKIFQWIDSVAEKGDDARLHCGFIAQEVEAAFLAEGLDPGRYGLFTRTPITKTVTKTREVEQQKMELVTKDREVIEVIDGRAVLKVVSVEVEQPVFEDLPLHDEAGDPVTIKVQTGTDEETGELIYEHQPVTHPVPVMETVAEEYQVQEPDGERLGLRYGELMCFLMAAG